MPGWIDVDGLLYLKKSYTRPGQTSTVQTVRKVVCLQGSLGPGVICSHSLTTAPPHGFLGCFFFSITYRRYTGIKYRIVFAVAGDWVNRIYPDRFHEAVPGPVLTPPAVSFEDDFAASTTY